MGDGEEASVRGCFASSIGGGEGIHAPGADVHNSRGIAVFAIGISAKNATGCTGISAGGVGLLVVHNAVNCSGRSSSGIGLKAGRNASNCVGDSFINVGLEAYMATSCTGNSGDSGPGLRVSGTASYCLGFVSFGGGNALEAAIAIGCTRNNGSISAPQKFLGTP